MPPPPRVEYINAIAAPPASIGTIITYCESCRAAGCGSAGGGSRVTSPVGKAGPSRRGGLLTMTVDMSPDVMRRRHRTTAGGH
ncbi:hypothetical protein GCM10010522_55900 [Kribbella solani]